MYLSDNMASKKNNRQKNYEYLDMQNDLFQTWHVTGVGPPDVHIFAPPPRGRRGLFKISKIPVWALLNDRE